MIRELTLLEKTNQELIDKFTTNSVNLILTETGFNKSIMDATYPVRYFFESNNLHLYREQNKGADSKKIIPAKYYFQSDFFEIQMSLYRPKTKDGDPRLWFNSLKQKKALSGACAFCLVFNKGQVFIFNLSVTNLLNDFNQSEKLRETLNSFHQEEESIAKELFDKIFALYRRGWIPAAGIGDKAVGETLEKELGIESNSSKNPDYKGIELKASRKGQNGRRKSRTNLFAQVADWSRSIITSSMEMLKTYGYFRDGKYRLNCTVSSQNINSQGLTFKIKEKDEELHEVFSNKGKITGCLVWPFELLIQRLKTKHNETFWVEAESRINSNGVEEFLYTKIIHTKKPFLNRLIPLIEDGTITMDHLISAKEGKSASERGPLFKMEDKNLHLLFPEPNIIFLSNYKNEID